MTTNVSTALGRLATLSEFTGTRSCRQCSQSFAATGMQTICDGCAETTTPLPLLTPQQRRELAWQESLPARQRAFDHKLLKPITLAEGLARRAYSGEYSALLLGPSESGKTYLAYRLARLAYLAGKDVLAMTADEMRAKWLIEGGGDKWLARLKRIPFLLIDDLGMEAASDGWRAAIYEVINKREEECLPTVITANKTREYFGKNYSTGLANRLWRMEVVRL